MIGIARFALLSLGLALPGAARVAPNARLAEIASPTGAPLAGKTLVSENDEINVLFFYATSPDMMSWSAPQLFMPTPPNIHALQTPGAAYLYHP